MTRACRGKVQKEDTSKGGRVVSQPSVTLYGIASMPEETFGSWFKRVAASHYVTRDELGEGLLAEGNRALPAGAIDWDLDPPTELLDAISSKLTTVSQAGLRNMIPGKRLDHLRARDRNAWCPQCWKKHITSGSVYVRKQWLRAWNTLCDVHRCPLVPIPRDFEMKLSVIYAGRGRRYMGYDEVIEPWLPPYSEECRAWFATVQRLFASEQPCDYPTSMHWGTAENPRKEERGILRDIVRLLGSRTQESGGDSLMAVIGRYGRQRWLCYDKTEDGNTEADFGPRGGIERRLELIRVAGCFWRWMHGEYREVSGSAERILISLIAQGGYRDEISRASQAWPYEYKVMAAEIGLRCGKQLDEANHSFGGYLASLG